MNPLKKQVPEWTLRFGFGCMFLYSGIDLIRHPTGWYWAVRPLPWVIQSFINNQIGIDQYLRAQGAVELLFALVFFAWFAPRWIVSVVSALVALEMAVILLFVGVIGDTFRDIGILGGAIALLINGTSLQSPVPTGWRPPEAREPQQNGTTNISQR